LIVTMTVYFALMVESIMFHDLIYVLFDKDSQ